MRVRSPWLGAVLAVLALAPAAQAQTKVAGPTASGYELWVDEREGYCLVVFKAGEKRYSECADRPDEGAVWLRTRLRYLPIVAGALATGERADVEDGDGTRTQLDVSPPVDGLRYFIAERPRGSRPWLVRWYDAGGNLLGAGASGAVTIAGPLRVASRSSVYVERFLSPVPDELDRTRTRPCLQQRSRFGRSWRCSSAAPRLRPLGEPWLEGGPSTVNGTPRSRPWRISFLTGPGVTAVETVLGSGRRVRTSVTPFPAAWATGIGFARLRIGRRDAVRTFELVAAGGRVLDRAEAGLPPLSMRFDSYSGITGFTEPALPRLPPITDAFGDPARTLLGGEVDGELCVALGAGSTCGDPPVSSEDSLILADAFPSGGAAVAGAVAPMVREVRLTPQWPEEGQPVTLPAEPMRAEGGRWAPHLRTIAGNVAEQGTFRAELLNEKGALLTSGNLDVYQEGSDDDWRVRLRVRPRGGPRVALAANGSGACFAVMVRGKPVAEDCLDELTVVSTCSPRVTFAAVWLFGKDGPRAWTARGRRLPRRTLPLGARRRAAIFPVPAGERIARISYVTKKGRRIVRRLGRVPSSREQCGWQGSIAGF